MDQVPSKDSELSREMPPMDLRISTESETDLEATPSRPGKAITSRSGGKRKQSDATRGILSSLKGKASKTSPSSSSSSSSSLSKVADDVNKLCEACSNIMKVCDENIIQIRSLKKQLSYIKPALIGSACTLTVVVGWLVYQALSHSHENVSDDADDLYEDGESAQENVA